jgi:hypothetical protein
MTQGEPIPIVVRDGLLWLDADDWPERIRITRELIAEAPNDYLRRTGPVLQFVLYNATATYHIADDGSETDEHVEAVRLGRWVMDSA